MTLPLALVVAVARNGAIGRDNRLIWRISTDMKRFKALTMGKPLLMGRLTWDSLGRPLPGRESIVLSADPAFRPEGAQVAPSLSEGLARCEEAAARLGAADIMVLGGARVFAETLPRAQRIHLTEVDAAPAAHVFFPSWEGGAFRAGFRETLREPHPAGPKDEHAFTFVDLERDGAPPLH